MSNIHVNGESETVYVFACMYVCMHVYDTPVSVLITDCRSLKFFFLRNTHILLFYYLQMIWYFWLDDLLCWQWNYSLEMSQLHHLLISIYFASVTGKLHQHTIPFILREMENLKDVQYFFVWNVDTSEGDKSVSNEEKIMKAGRNYVFFHALSTAFLDQCDYKGIICWWIYIYTHVLEHPDRPPFNKECCSWMW